MQLTGGCPSSELQFLAPIADRLYRVTFPAPYGTLACAEFMHATIVPALTAADDYRGATTARRRFFSGGGFGLGRWPLREERPWSR